MSQWWHIPKLFQWKERLSGKQPLVLWEAEPSMLLEPVGWILSSFQGDEEIFRVSSKADFFPVRKCSQRPIWSVHSHSDPPCCQSTWRWMVILRVKQAQGSVGLCVGVYVFEVFGSPSWKRSCVMKEDGFAKATVLSLGHHLIPGRDVRGPQTPPTMASKVTPQSPHSLMTYWVGNTHAVKKHRKW